MTFRRRLTVLAASSLLLAGCAVPGEGTPGVAAEVDGVAVTSADLDATAAAWQADTDGALVPARPVLATYALLGPDLIEAAVEVEPALTPGAATAYAELLLSYLGVEDGEPSDEVVETVHAMLATWVLSYTDPELAAVAEIADAAAEDGEFSPRLGDLSAEALTASVTGANAQAEQLQLGQYTFVAFASVTGFAPADAPWAARG